MDWGESSSSWSHKGDLDYYKEKAPLGYRFEPTDVELLGYLSCKKEGRPEGDMFEFVPLYEYDPDELQCKFNKWKGDDLYVYTKIKLLCESKADRKAKNGSWASSIGETEIRDRHGVTIGYKRTLTFAYPQEGKKKKKKTTWNMHEYRLLYQNGKRKLQRDNLVLCKIYKRRSSGKTQEALNDRNSTMASMANSTVDANIGSCSSLQSQSTVSVSNGLEHPSSDVGCLEYGKNNAHLQVSSKDSNSDEWFRELLTNDVSLGDPFVENSNLPPQSSIDDDNYWGWSQVRFPSDDENWIYQWY